MTPCKKTHFICVYFQSNFGGVLPRTPLRVFPSGYSSSGRG